MKNILESSVKTEIVPVLLILAAIFSSFYFYANFPDQVATHWNFKGVPDDYSSKFFGAFFFPGLILGIYLLLHFVPFIDPKRDRYIEFRKVYHVFKGALIGILTVLYFLTSLNGLGYNIRIEVWVPVLIGLLFVAIGNYFGKIKSNWMFGIRTPWTLSNEEVWNKTHRLGGKMFILGGVLIALNALLPETIGIFVFVLAILLAAVVPIVYSYILFRRLKQS